MVLPIHNSGPHPRWQGGSKVCPNSKCLASRPSWKVLRNRTRGVSSALWASLRALRERKVYLLWSQRRKPPTCLHGFFHLWVGLSPPGFSYQRVFLISAAGFFLSALRGVWQFNFINTHPAEAGNTNWGGGKSEIRIQKKIRKPNPNPSTPIWLYQFPFICEFLISAAGCLAV